MEAALFVCYSDRMRRKADLVRHDYKSEAELCAVFSEHAKAQGWIVFPETGDHDLLLVATKDVKTRNARAGDQLGIQAKLKANVSVLSQAMPKFWSERGPHFHGVLVPVASKEFSQVAFRCGIVVLEGTRRTRLDGRWRRERGAEGGLVFLPPSLRHYYDEYEWHPDVEIWVPAGVKSPKKITPWKISAVKLCLEALRRGFITSADFRQAGVSMTVWRQKGWIASTGEKVGRGMKYVLVDSAIPPHLAWPEITERLNQDNKLDSELSRRQLRAIGATG